ncbi:helix-turn-helix domain-containing protein [Thermogutta sp.]|uniref:DnaA/Hda family protein n=1 Tax=Thermogutta sp. TaxID=1962930 RepID=UPI00321FF267
MPSLELQFNLPGVTYLDGEGGTPPPDYPGQFFVAQENWLAVAAVERFLEPDPPGTLALFGPPGTGKTHLLDILEREFQRRNPEAVTLRQNAAEFGQAVAEALANRRHRAFRKTWQAASLVILDDLQFLVEYPAGQEECVVMLQAAERGSPRVAVASRVRPWHITDLDDRVGEILVGGLTAPLALPGVSVRKALFQGAFRRHGFLLTDAAADLLARELPLSPRQILGFAQEAAHNLGERHVDYALAQSLVRTHNKRALVSMEQIARATARYFHIPLKRLRGPGREREEVLARDIAMYLSQKLAKRTLKEIGRYFGGRDHTTVGHGCRKVEELATTDMAVREALLVIEELLGVT